jgi:hypothetical protein
MVNQDVLILHSSFPEAALGQFVDIIAPGSSMLAET